MCRTGIKRFAAGFFLLLLVACYANATLFGHSHVVQGVTVVHSHFHFESHHATASGGHTRAELVLIAALNQVQYIGLGAFLCGLTVVFRCCGLAAELRVQASQAAVCPGCPRRGPPLLR